MTSHNKGNDLFAKSILKRQSLVVAASAGEPTRKLPTAKTSLSTKKAISGKNSRLHYDRYVHPTAHCVITTATSTQLLIASLRPLRRPPQYRRTLANEAEIQADSVELMDDRENFPQ